MKDHPKKRESRAHERRLPNGKLITFEAAQHWANLPGVRIHLGEAGFQTVMFLVEELEKAQMVIACTFEKELERMQPSGNSG